MLRLTNPLNYPLAVAAGSVILFSGVRIVGLPSYLMLPTSVIAGFVAAGFLHQREYNRQSSSSQIGNESLAKELEEAKQEALNLIEKAESLRQEAQTLLREASQMDLLTSVEYMCDRILELPQKIEELSNRLSGDDSLLSLENLQAKLRENRKRQKGATGVALEKLKQIEMNLLRNIELTEQAKSARQAQVFSVTSMLTEAAGILQELQNKLRRADLQNVSTLNELQELTQQLSELQEKTFLTDWTLEGDKNDQ
ncbi:MAG: hypothetical protein NZ901_12440 [Geminocystis sp.]|nr:hypothetical protein [Geminocystis sp.]HIK38001.1 hypothetical protein [Geminocystis sp. M7585_C2015_104]MCS7148977.1 hypothetical protein [Geminocystis sp.]MCX8077567.1 hypothetical protein [Geminocystis sp.]MDW8117176.1 hypothetical protein [Geminocystis sp.]